MQILVDADACPVKDEIYKVAWRREVPVKVVSNSWLRVPDHPLIERVVVSDRFDAADDWIAQASDDKAVVVTGDILLAERCLKTGAVVIAHNGKPFTSASIGGAIATRAIMADLRVAADGITGGPAPFTKADRSRFLQALDEALVRLQKAVRSPASAGAARPGATKRREASLDTKQIEGRCLCGAVTVCATPVRQHVEACHCVMCRRWGGSALLSVQCGSDVEIDGEAHVARYRSSQWAERGFCRQCGSNLFYRYVPADSYAFTAGLFPDDALLALREEIFIDEKPAYYAFAGDTEKLTGPEAIAKAKAQGFTFDQE